MGENIRLTAADGFEFGAYRALALERRLAFFAEHLS
jgi:hypothetical protein